MNHTLTTPHNSDGIVTTPVTSSEGKTLEYPYLSDMFGLVAEVQMNTR